VGRRLTRKQIKKHDHFLTFVDRAMLWMNANWRQAAMGLGGAVLLGFLYWGVTAVLASRVGAAAGAFARSLEIYTAPIADSEPAGAKVWFATESARMDAADEAFRSLASRYRWTPQGRMARLYRARIAGERGDLARATRELTELAGRRTDTPVVRMATMDLFRLRLSQGEGLQLVRDLEAMVAGRDPRLPRDAAMYLLAEVWEREGKDEEAVKLFRKLKDDFPESPYRSEAEKRVSAAN
jgi:hypothetical protein